jgi:hypothetical protein
LSEWDIARLAAQAPQAVERAFHHEQPLVHAKRLASRKFIIETIMDTSELSQQFPASHAANQPDRGLTGGVGRPPRPDKLPDRDREAQQGYCRRGPGENAEDPRIGRQIFEQNGTSPVARICSCAIYNLLGPTIAMGVAKHASRA